MNWHSRDIDEVLERLEATPTGLGADEARRRLREHGPNKLEEAKQEGALRRLLRQFHDILIYILIAAAVLTAFLGEWIDTGVIAAVVLINAVIGFVQEGKAEEALEEIRRMLSLEANVVRDGERRKIGAQELVPGDIVALASGDRVPADMRLIEVKNLEAEEAPLTGESESVDKAVEPVAEHAALGDRRSMAYSGTTVVRGTARGVVVATGRDTEVGQIGEMVSGVERLKTPLLRKIDRFGKWLSVIIVALAAALFAFGWFTRPYDLGELFMLVVSLAVASIPEGLPAIMTITLALGVRRMAERNAIVRKLPAVETLGSVTVICSDKTGTLTHNEMTARAVITAHKRFDVTGEGYAPQGELLADDQPVALAEQPLLEELVRAAALCNDTALAQDERGDWTIDGEPTEGALVVLAARAGLDRDHAHQRFGRRDTIPFESERRYMATLHEVPDDGRVIYLKGAPEKVLTLCDRQRTDDDQEQLDADWWKDQVDSTAAEGFRLLAIARGEADDDVDDIDDQDIGEDFVLLGMVAMFDPPREEAIAAVEQAHRAGVRVKMITGDHAQTARSIGERMDIGRGKEAATGQQIDQADDQALAELARQRDVFARTSPAHKLRLVEALQAQDDIVAMTGDGVNDAPAVKRADVGVAMGIKGTEATKQAADMVLADDNFASIERAIGEGRTIYDNLKKTILFLLPTNGAEAMMVLAAVFLAMEHLPITPVQILWVNMITAVTLALALAFEPAEADVMDRPPRGADASILAGWGLTRLGIVALLIGTLALISFFGARADGLSIAVARTVAVNTLVAGQLFYLFNSRFLLAPSYTWKGLVGNRVALGAAGLLVVFQLVFTYTPIFQTWFETAGLAWSHWVRVLGAGLLVFIIVEIEKAVVRRFDLHGRSQRQDRGPSPAQRQPDEARPSAQ